MSYRLHPRVQNKTDSVYITINYKDIEKLFNMTTENACKYLGISKTSLKKICRHFNIPKWPHKRLSKNNIIKPAIPINEMNIVKTINETKYRNDLKYIKNQEIYNDLSFLTGLNITENPYELQKILSYFY
jgi:hypothetical protein